MSKLYSNSISTTGGFQFNADMPLDDRLVVETFADLSTITKYEGMIVYVKNDKHYKYTNGAWTDLVIETVVDQTFSAESTNAQSGTAVASAISSAMENSTKIQFITWEANDIE